jgi:hypothetical protein
MKMEAGVLFQPFLNVWVGVSTVVIKNQMEIQLLWGFSVDFSEEF